MTLPQLRIATRKGLFSTSRDNGWELASPDFLGDNCSAVLRHPVSKVIYVALDHGHFGVKLHRSSDGGESYVEIPTPAYPPTDENAEPWVDMMGRTIPDSLQLIWSLEAGHAEQGERLWAGTIPGGLFRSDDGGDSWELVESLWNDPARRKWFGGGMDFPGIQDVHRLARCRSVPDLMWLQHHAGVYRSDNAGHHWQMIEGVQPSSFGFAAVVHPQQPDTAWFVPETKDEHRIPADGKVVINRTDDGGNSFNSFSQGLPGPNAYDLVFRHALDVDQRGETLAMGSTTGSLWVSDNGGKDWETVSNHLPPIYALRFDPS